MTREQALTRALKQIVDSIPRRGADWLDPDVERFARDLLKQQFVPAADAEVSARYMIEFKLDNGVWWLWGGGHELPSIEKGHEAAYRSLKAGTEYRITTVGPDAIGPFVVPAEAAMRSDATEDAPRTPTGEIDMMAALQRAVNKAAMRAEQEQGNA